MSNGYKRTSSYKNWMNQRCYLARIVGLMARLASGRIYKIGIDGFWRRA